MNRFTLFGPPGVGKSTLIKLAKEKGIEAYDMEEFHKDEQLEKLKELLENEKSDFVLYGTADLKDKDFPKDTIHILLLPEPKELYMERVNERNRENPHRAGQREEDWYDEFKKWQHLFDYVYTDIASPEETLNWLIGLKDKAQ